MNWNATHITTKQAHALCLGAIARAPACVVDSTDQIVMDKNFVDHQPGGSDG